MPKQRIPSATARAATVEVLAGEGGRDAESAPDLAPVVGKNVRRERAQRGLSLEALAKLSGVSRAMLGQIELGHSAPTINVLWKIARAFRLPFAALMATHAASNDTRVLKVAHTKVLRSKTPGLSSRALFPFDGPRRVEFYELELSRGCEEVAEAHAAGTRENLVVQVGCVEVALRERAHRLEAGDAIAFVADVAHTYRNVGATDARMYLVMTYTGEHD